MLDAAITANPEQQDSRQRRRHDRTRATGVQACVQRENPE